MFQKHFVTRKTARVFYNLEEPSPGTEYLWICLHGYGQLGQYFIQNFSILDSSKHWVVAPEGLSRMYLEGVYGRVGASWMTKEDRLTEIDDYLEYLNSLSQTLLQSLPTHVKVVVFGFSQGAATACRWVFQGAIKPSHLVLWSGIFPPDLQLENEGNFPFKTWQLIGDEDPYMNDERWKENAGIISNLGVKATIIPFQGVHKIYKDALLDLVERIDQ